MIRERDQEGNHAGSSEALSGLLWRLAKLFFFVRKCDTPLYTAMLFLYKQSQEQPHFCYILLSGLQGPGERRHKTCKNRFFLECTVQQKQASVFMNYLWPWSMNSCWAHHCLDRMQEFSIVALKCSKQVRGQRAKVSFLHQGLYSVYLV